MAKSGYIRIALTGIEHSVQFRAERGIRLVTEDKDGYPNPENIGPFIHDQRFYGFRIDDFTIVKGRIGAR